MFQGNSPCFRWFNKETLWPLRSLENFFPQVTKSRTSVTSEVALTSTPGNSLHCTYRLDSKKRSWLIKNRGLPREGQVIPDHGNCQKRRTLFSTCLFKCDWINYQNFYQVFEISSWKAEIDQETTRKAFYQPPRDLKHQKTRPFATAFNRFTYIGENGIWWFPGNRLGASI